MEVESVEEKKFVKSLKGDFSEEVDAKIPLYISPVEADASKLDSALTNLLQLEKKTRLAADTESTQKLAKAIIDLCIKCKQWKTLNNHIAILCKRRAQLRKVISTVVQTAMGALDMTPNMQTKVDLIETLRTVSAGKLMVELERARLTKTLAKIREDEGKEEDACSILQEVQVETIGSMELKEKAEFLLEQIRLCIQTNKWIRASIVAKKVNTEKLKESGFGELQWKFYNLMIKYYSHEDAFFDTCKCYHSLFKIKQEQKEVKAYQEALKNAVVYLCLSPYDSEMSDMIHRFKMTVKELNKLPMAKNLVELFTTDELIPWPLNDEFKTSGEFKSMGYDAQFQRSVVQHNIRVLSKYYSRIKSERLAFLLGLSEEKTEAYLSEMVQSKQLHAKIDRPAQIVTFARKKTANEVVDEWSSDVSKLLGLVEKTCHLINKEMMVAKIKAKKK
mmetsp:Transcript_29938/g.41724  ORF Transcript_29938/g.41724 Transcript_29938/m.41724 type:complete len:447 (-) Transcript_29938:103-1443(-)|eukprot:CAMPEP_0185269012 /NCGR_PEP_ID=MMETSP1359-20130426/38622_1 /TAXON_ID=552665 /ORGANISM="Bigelowiella longifila, Strain CCMP242" /LENGTH=446 /DNA_ID=CAMNT_0027859995 /DNA_START=9 /DNA_END=1349 /DNA_ORIENTATION=+